MHTLVIFFKTIAMIMLLIYNGYHYIMFLTMVAQWLSVIAGLHLIVAMVCVLVVFPSVFIMIGIYVLNGFVTLNTIVIVNSITFIIINIILGIIVYKCGKYLEKHESSQKKLSE